MNTKSLEEIAQEAAKDICAVLGFKDWQTKYESIIPFILAACEKAYDVGHNEGLSEAFELWRRQEVTATQPQRSEPRICDQCSRKLEDGALYEDHSKQTTTTDTASLSCSAEAPQDKRLSSAGEQEWTPEKVQRLMGIPNGTSGTVNWTEALKRIADALDAETNRADGVYDAWIRDVNTYEQQLAAEQEKVEHLKGELKLSNDALSPIQQELFAAQAMIAEVLKSPASHNTLIESVLKLKSVDLSALEKHDAEVRRPLVKALEQLVSKNPIDGRWYLRNEIYSEYHGAPILNDKTDRMITDALANAKEEK